MYYGQSTFMYSDQFTSMHVCTRIKLRACTMIRVDERTMVNIHACTLIIVHACTLSKEHARTSINMHACAMKPQAAMINGAPAAGSFSCAGLPLSFRLASQIATRAPEPVCPTRAIALVHLSVPLLAGKAGWRQAVPSSPDWSKNKLLV